MGTNDKILTIKEQVADLEAILGTLDEENINILKANKQAKGLLEDYPASEVNIMIAANYIYKTHNYLDMARSNMKSAIEFLTKLYTQNTALNKDEEDEEGY
jgi:transposase